MKTSGRMVDGPTRKVISFYIKIYIKPFVGPKVGRTIGVFFGLIMGPTYSFAKLMATYSFAKRAPTLEILEQQKLPAKDWNARKGNNDGANPTTVTKYGK